MVLASGRVQPFSPRSSPWFRVFCVQPLCLFCPYHYSTPLSHLIVGLRFRAFISEIISSYLFIYLHICKISGLVTDWIRYQPWGAQDDSSDVQRRAHAETVGPTRCGQFAAAIDDFGCQRRTQSTGLAGTAGPTDGRSHGHFQLVLQQFSCSSSNSSSGGSFWPLSFSSSRHPAQLHFSHNFQHDKRTGIDRSIVHFSLSLFGFSFRFSLILSIVSD